MSTSSTNSWLRAQRKTDLVEVADNVGLKNYDGLKKVELEAALDDFLAENTERLSGRSELQGYYNSRSKALGSPVKRETVKDEADKALKVVKKRASKATEDIAAEAESARASTTALVQTPGRGLSQVAARIPLPATPADVANAVDRSTLVVRQRVSSIYNESGISEVTQATRESLSTIHAIIILISVFELWFIRSEVLSDRYAFTIPAINLLGTSDYPVYLPDMFLLLTSSFWSPALTWSLTSFVIPTILGYFFNLNASAQPAGPRTRSRTHAGEYRVDPLTFSIAKAVVSFVVYGQGVTFGGLLSDVSIERLNNSVYGGYKGILAGAAITGLSSIYEAILRK
jgi:hypothetical protein